MATTVFLTRCLLLSLIFLFGVALSAQAQAVRSDKRPAWVNTKPKSKTHYIGVGAASKSMLSYQSAARKNALLDLLGEIKISVSSASVLSQMEKNGSIKEEYESVIRASVADELQEFEQVDAFETDSLYWVCYQLSKKDYAAQKGKGMGAATRIAVQFYEKALDAEKADAYPTAIDFYIKTLLALKEYWAEAVEAQVAGKTVSLPVESYARLQQLLDKLSLHAETPIVKLTLQQQGSVPLKWKAVAGNRPIEKLPLLISVAPQGTSGVYLTDQKGEAMLLLTTAMMRPSLKEARAMLDLNSFSKSSADDKFYAYIVGNLRAPSSAISFDIQSPSPRRVANDLYPFNAEHLFVDFANEKKYTFKNLRLVPIRGNLFFREAAGNAGYYVPLQAAIDSGKIIIREESASGRVNTLLIRNLSQDTIFVMAGEVLQGGKQDRVIASDMLIAPQSGQVKLPVFCVEKGRWKYKGDETDTKFKEYYGMANEHLRNLIDRRANQTQIWDDVKKSNERDHIDSETDAYTAHEKNMEFRREEAAYLNFFQNVFEQQADVVGVVAVSGNQIEGCDVFISNQLFRQEFPKLIYSYIDDAITYGSAISVSQAEIERYVATLLNPDTQRAFVDEKGKVFQRGNQIIHIAIY